MAVQQGCGERPAAARSRPSEDAHSIAGSILPFRVPAWGPGGRGPPVGSRGASTSRRVCPQAERRAGEEPRPLQPRRARPRPSPHGAPAAPRSPSPAFSAALALTLRTDHRNRSPQGHRPRTMTRPPVSLNTGPRAGGSAQAQQPTCAFGPRPLRSPRVSLFCSSPEALN